MSKKLNVLLGIPFAHSEGITPQTYETINKLKASAEKFNWNITERSISGHFIDNSRAMIAAAVDQNDPAIPVEYPGLPYDKCLMIDRDNSASPQQIKSIVEGADPVMSAVYEVRGGEGKYSSAVRRFQKDGYVEKRDFYTLEESGIKQVAGTGMGLIAFDKCVFEKIWDDMPWFPHYYVRYKKSGRWYWDCQGEDMGFSYYTAKKHEIPIKVNFDIQAGHHPEEAQRAGDNNADIAKQAQGISNQAKLMDQAITQIKSNLSMLDVAMKGIQQNASD